MLSDQEGGLWMGEPWLYPIWPRSYDIPRGIAPRRHRLVADQRERKPRGLGPEQDHFKFTLVGIVKARRAAQLLSLYRPLCREMTFLSVLSVRSKNIYREAPEHFCGEGKEMLRLKCRLPRKLRALHPQRSAPLW